jgi:hypothetical protein
MPAPPRATVPAAHRWHSVESVMDHFQYCAGLSASSTSRTAPSPYLVLPVYQSRRAGPPFEKGTASGVGGRRG